jgi:predicted DNA-binding transcriptional regulator AlpA
MDETKPANTPRYATIPRWCDLSGMGRTTTYEAIGRGDLRAVKLGNRTLLDVDHGLAWMRSLPAAKIAAPRAA